MVGINIVSMIKPC